MSLATREGFIDTAKLLGSAEELSAEARELLRQGHFKEVLPLLDQVLVQNPNDALVKLWWVRCHIEGQSLPLSALTAPLEEIMPHLRSTLGEVPHTARLAATTFFLLGDKLLARAQGRLAQLMLERSLSCAERASAVLKEEFELVRLALLQALDEEITRADGRLEKKSYLAELREKRKQVSAPKQVKPLASLSKVAPSKESEPIKAPATNSTLLSSKTILSNLSSNEKASGETVSAREEREAPHFDLLPRPKGSRQAIPLFLMVLLLLGLSASVFFGSSLFAPNVEEVLAMRTELPFAASLPLPEIEGRLAVQEEGSALQSVVDRLSRMSLEETPAEAPPPDPAKDPEVDVAATVATSPETEPPAPAKLEGSSGENPSTGVKPKLPQSGEKSPLLDPAKLAAQQIQIDQVGGSGKGVPTEGGYVKGADGKLYGPPLDAAAVGGKGGVALDGSAVQSYAVERFDPPLVYKTLTATNVLSAPSVLAHAVARLVSDAEIKVVARMGKWLEIQSTGGSRGFIYAQDAIAQN